MNKKENIVISQPMYFPWIGMFEQIRLSDTFIFYDDVQFSKGSFTNRVQIKSGNKEGFKWLTVPLENLQLGVKINEILLGNHKNWRNEHYTLIQNSYQKAPYFDEMFFLVKEVLENDYNNLSELSIASMCIVCKYYNLDPKFLKSSKMNIGGTSSQRVLAIVKELNGKTYITGHGAKKYLDHGLFEKNDINVQYIDYQMLNYPQIHGPFNPYVSILDLIANTGKAGIQFINSSTKSWKEL